MKRYRIYTARLHYHEFNTFITEKEAYDLDGVKKIISQPAIRDNQGVNIGGWNLNPFYTVIIDVTDGAKIIEHNKHLSFCEAKK